MYSFRRPSKLLSYLKPLHSSSVTRRTLKISSPMKNSDLVIVDHLESITTIGINRPSVRNCVNAPTADALVKAFQDFDNDQSSKVAVLYGVGGNFSAGFDLKELGENPNPNLLIYGPGGMGPTRLEITKPVIGAIEGYAVAGGFELALWCDLRIVEETTVMGVFCRRFGVPLIDGGTVRLQAIVGLGRALDLILTGRPIKGLEAHNWGLATELVPCGAAIGRAVKLAQSLLKFPQECMKADLVSTYNAAFASNSIQEALRFEHKNGIRVLEEESIPGAQKFVSGIGRHGKFNIDPDYDPTKSRL